MKIVPTSHATPPSKSGLDLVRRPNGGETLDRCFWEGLPALVLVTRRCRGSATGARASLGRPIKDGHSATGGSPKQKKIRDRRSYVVKSLLVESNRGMVRGTTLNREAS